jgi:sugar (pentulose or hexulose) kinase
MQRKAVDTDYIAVIDFGTSSGRCLFIDTSGRVIGRENTQWDFCPKYIDRTVHASFDMNQACRLIFQCCRQTFENSGVDPENIACVIATSQRHGAVLLDSAGESLMAFSNADERSTPRWREIIARDPEAIYRTTGRWPQDIFLPAHLSWLECNLPEVYRQVAKLLGIQDWMIYRLSGELCTEATIATDLLLFDILKNHWSEDLLELFNVAPSWLPPVVEAGQKVGVVSKAVSSMTGFLQGTPVLNGGADSQMAVLGLGAIQTSDLAVAFGSSAPLLLVMEKPLFHYQARTWTDRQLSNGGWLLESNAGDAGLCLSQFRDHFLPQFHASVDNSEDGILSSLNHLDNLVSLQGEDQSRLSASFGPVVFDGRNWPKSTGVVKGVNLLSNGRLNVMQIYRSLVHNIGYAILGNLKQLEATVQEEIAEVRVGGPAMESPLWPEFLANVLGRPVQIPDEKEATSMGAAALSAWAMGHYPTLTAAVQEMVRLNKVQPNQDLVPTYQKKYEEWLQVYEFSIR